MARVMVRSFGIKRGFYPAYRASVQTIFLRKNRRFYLTSDGCAKSARRYREETNSAIRRRMFASGNRPVPACRLSWRWLGLFVAGMAHVTAGCAAIHLRKNWAHDRQSNSAAQPGNGFDAALFFPLPQGRQVRVNIEQVVHLH